MKYYVIDNDNIIYYGDVFEVFDKTTNKYVITHNILKYYTPTLENGEYEEIEEKNARNDFAVSKAVSSGRLNNFPTLNLAKKYIIDTTKAREKLAPHK